MTTAPSQLIQHWRAAGQPLCLEQGQAADRLGRIQLTDHQVREDSVRVLQPFDDHPGGKTTAKTSAEELQALEQRFEQLEHVVLLIAQQVGVPQKAIAQLAMPGSPTPS